MNFKKNAILTEPGVKYFLSETLKNVNKEKRVSNNFIINVGMFIGFVVTIGLILSYKYKNKPTPLQKKQNDLLKEGYILNKIRELNIEKKKETEKMITNLPKFESDFVKLHKNFYNI